MPLSASKIEFDRLIKKFNTDPTIGTFNFLLLGDFGTGKTKILETARKPVLVACFDPGGTNSIRDRIVSETNPTGDILVVKYDVDDKKNPTAFKRFSDDLDGWIKTGFLSQFGTFCIDSTTTLILSAMSFVLKNAGRAGQQAKLPDYQVVGNTIIDMVKACTAAPCDFIMTGHLVTEKDETTGMVKSRISAYPHLANLIPLLFDEIYAMVTQPLPGGTIAYKVLTKNTGYYNVRTRLGNNNQFSMYEDADISAMRKKVNLPNGDLPLPWLEKGEDVEEK